MANCPKCNEHLRLIDWKQKCPHCGANIVLYDLQERLMLDADKAEVQYYHFQKKIDMIKAAFVGTKLAIVRIFTSLLPLGPLFLPLVKANLSAPLREKSGNISIIDLYNLIGGFKIKEFLAETDPHKIALLVSVISLLLSVVTLVVHFVMLAIACAPKGKPRNYILDILLLVFSAVSAGAFIYSTGSTFISGSLAVGTYLYFVLSVVNFVFDILVFRQGIEITHKQCYVGGIPIEEYFQMLEDEVPHEQIREEMYKRLNAIQAEKDRKLAEAEEKLKQKQEKEKEATVNG